MNRRWFKILPGGRFFPASIRVDVGCGVRVVPFHAGSSIDCHAFHEFIVKCVSSERDIKAMRSAVVGNHSHISGTDAGILKPVLERYDEASSRGLKLLSALTCLDRISDIGSMNGKNIGVLGGNSHFIELDRDDEGNMYLAIHSGSGTLSGTFQNIYIDMAFRKHAWWVELMAMQNALIDEYRSAGRQAELKEAVRDLRSAYSSQHRSPFFYECWIEGCDLEYYLHDMRICQKWAALSRELIADILSDYLEASGCPVMREDAFDCIHNGISDGNTVRLGAVSATKGEKCLITLNMRDGSLICVGKGNEDSLCSAPQGSDRVIYRGGSYGREMMDHFISSMKGIYCEKFNVRTKDDSPAVYEPAEKTIDRIRDTVDVVKAIRPVFNFREEMLR